MNKPNITSFCSIFLLLLPFFLSAKAAHAVDTEWEVMQRMQSDTAVRIAYQETRILELIDQPWQGSGYLYSMAPDLMIKEQLQHVARMQRSGIREWRGSELPGLRYAPSGLRCFDPPTLMSVTQSMGTP
ncbi:hypothetical protein [Methylotuvimicrobium sp. KM2]|uniref:hypothetical protein n=1 Tax=Methylotuvimicrobium sp. KM2 TaxID=3133976 RepID=UPI00310153DC